MAFVFLNRYLDISEVNFFMIFFIIIIIQMAGCLCVSSMYGCVFCVCAA